MRNQIIAVRNIVFYATIGLVTIILLLTIPRVARDTVARSNTLHTSQFPELSISDKISAVDDLMALFNDVFADHASTVAPEQFQIANLAAQDVSHRLRQQIYEVNFTNTMVSLTFAKLFPPSSSSLCGLLRDHTSRTLYNNDRERAEHLVIARTSLKGCFNAVARATIILSRSLRNLEMHIRRLNDSILDDFELHDPDWASVREVEDFMVVVETTIRGVRDSLEVLHQDVSFLLSLLVIQDAYASHTISLPPDSSVPAFIKGWFDVQNQVFGIDGSGECS